MKQLILHLIGDYILQNDWMALNKKDKSIKGFFACLIHCVLYGLPFILISNWLVVWLIVITHFIIDRTNIIVKILAWKNGVEDYTDNFGFSKDRPIVLTIWLLIIVDNTFHLIINYLLIKYLT